MLTTTWEIVLNTFLLIFSVQSKNLSSIQNEFMHPFALTANFFIEQNQEEDENKFSLSDLDKVEINEEIFNYLQIIKQINGFFSKNTFAKRSLCIDEDTFADQEDVAGIWVLNGLQSKMDLKVKFPIDIVLFKVNNGVESFHYAATLESNSSDLHSESPDLVIYKFTSKFNEVYRKPQAGSIKIETFTRNGQHYLVLARKNVSQDSLTYEGSTIFQIGFDGLIDSIQNIKTPNIANFAIWEHLDELYMVVTESIEGNIFEKESKIQIFRWTGNYFDIIDKIMTSQMVKNVIPFQIGTSAFIALINVQNQFDEMENNLIVYKYDIDEDKFNLYQKLPTEIPTVDVNAAFFQFEVNHEKESFLIVTNSYQSDFNFDVVTPERSSNLEMEFGETIVYKFIDGYFIPFQVLRSVDLIDEVYPVQGANGEFFVVIIHRSDGYKLYQYDGWRFVESNEMKTKIFPPGVKQIRTYHLEENIFIVTVNINDVSESSFSIIIPKFIYINMYHDFEKNMETWTNEMLLLIEQQNEYISELNAKLESQKAHQLGQKTSAAALASNNMRVAFDILSQQTDEETPTVGHLIAAIERLGQQLEDLEIIFENLIKTNETITIDGTLRLNNVNLFCNNNSCNMNHVKVDHLLEVDVEEFFHNIYDINSGFATEKFVAFEDVIIESEINPMILNRHHVDQLIHKTQENNFNELVINGNANFEKNLFIDNTIDNLIFHPDTIMLTSGNQVFNGALIAENVTIKNLNSNQINDIVFHDEISHFGKINFFHTKSVGTINVKNLLVGELFNGVDVNILNEHALKHFGDQTITAPYKFDKLSAKNLHTSNKMSGNEIFEFIPITKGKFVLNQNIEFVQNISVKNFFVHQKINQIPVTKSKLSLLLKNHNETQFLTGIKIFDNVDLLNPIKLQGQIQSDWLNRKKPVSLISEKLDLAGDFFISENVTIENILQAKNLRQNNNPLNSLRRLYETGLKLNEPIFSPNFIIEKAIEVNKLISHEINGIDSKNWMLMGTDEDQIFTGNCTFVDNLEILGHTIPLMINKINLTELDAQSFKIDGLQVITGQIKFNNLHINDLVSNDTFFKSERIDEKLLDTSCGTQCLLKIDSLTITGNLKIDQINVKGQIIHKENFKEITELHSANITIGNLNNVHVINGMDFNTICRQIDEWMNELYFPRNQNLNIEMLDFLGPIQVERLLYDGHINQIPYDLETIWLTNDNQTIAFDQIFSNVIVNGKTQVSSNHINENNVDFQKLIWTNQDENLANVEFEELRANAEILIKGKLSSLNFDELILSNSSDKEYLKKVVFESNLTVIGDLETSQISGYDLTRIQDLSLNKFNSDVNLTIMGNAKFDLEPKVLLVNEYIMDDLKEKVWLRNENVKLEGLCEFEQMNFGKKTLLKGRLNRFDLSELKEIYFSKSLNQTTASEFYFNGGVKFENDLYANEAKVFGKIGEIDLNEFDKNVLKQNLDQHFENEMHFDKISLINNIIYNNAINGYNLQSEILRYDSPSNVITGSKTFKNLKTTNLKLPYGNTIQNIDLHHWIKNAMQIQSTMNFKNEITFKSVNFSNNLNVEELVNGISIDDGHILLRNSKSKQIISGLKTLNTSNYDLQDNPIKAIFKKLIPYGLINDYDLINILLNQAYKSESFQLKNAINLVALSTKYLQVENKIFDLNVTEIINDLDSNYGFDYLESEYNELLNKSLEIVDNLKRQPYYLDHYEIVQTFKGNFEAVLPIQLLPNICNNHIAIATKISDGNLVINFYKDDQNNFVIDEDLQKIVTNTDTVSFISKIKFYEKEILFVENAMTEPNEYTHEANLFIIENNALLVPQRLPTNGTNYIESFRLQPKGDICIFLLNEKVSQIYCEKSKNNLDLYLLQEIPTPGGTTASIISIEYIPHIIIINKIGLNSDWSVSIWKWHYTKEFIRHQVLRVTSPKSIATIEYEGSYFLAIASGHLKDAIHPGSVDIKKFDRKSGKFINWPNNQRLPLKAPVCIEFARLPSNELVLYALTDNPTEPLIVFIYRGMSGFIRQVSGSTIPNSLQLRAFTTLNQSHYLIVNNENEVRIIKAVFDGNRLMN